MIRFEQLLQGSMFEATWVEQIVWNNVQIMNKKLLWLWEKHDNHLSQTVAMINRHLRYLGPWHEGATEGILQRDKIGGANWRHPAKETRLKEPTEGILQDNH